MIGQQQQPQQQWTQKPYVGGSRVELHKGVVQFMNGVYAWMAVGVAVTAAVSFGLASDPRTVAAIYMNSSGTGISMLGWILMLSPLAFAWFLPARIPKMERGMAVGAFMVFAALLGAAICYVPLVYQSTDIILAFGISAGMFAGMALIGYTTKKDLSGMGQFLIMALIGAVIASLVNVIFVGSMGMSLLISGVVVVVAAGLTAYHTQTVKQLYLMHGGKGNLAVLGALLLYVDFINMFLALLRLLGGSRD